MRRRRRRRRGRITKLKTSSAKCNWKAQKKSCVRPRSSLADDDDESDDDDGDDGSNAAEHGIDDDDDQNSNGDILWYIVICLLNTEKSLVFDAFWRKLQQCWWLTRWISSSSWRCRPACLRYLHCYTAECQVSKSQTDQNGFVSALPRKCFI